VKIKKAQLVSAALPGDRGLNTKSGGVIMTNIVSISGSSFAFQAEHIVPKSLFGIPDDPVSAFLEANGYKANALGNNPGTNELSGDLSSFFGLAAQLQPNNTAAANDDAPITMAKAA
jgi:hypothetical protein